MADPVRVERFVQTPECFFSKSMGPGFDTGVDLGGEDFRAYHAKEFPTRIYIADGYVIAMARALGWVAPEKAAKLEARVAKLEAEVAALTVERDELADLVHSVTGLRSEDGWERKHLATIEEVQRTVLRHAQDQVEAAGFVDADGIPFRIEPPDKVRRTTPKLQREPVVVTPDDDAGVPAGRVLV